MNIPKRLAEKLWSEHPQVLKQLRGQTHLRVLESFTDEETVILRPYGTTNVDNGWSMQCTNEWPSVTVQLSKVVKA